MSIKRKVYEIGVSITKMIQWKCLSSVHGWKGTTQKKYENDIVVSLTTFPPRINDVVETLKTILMQNLKPNHIVLWLASSQFPDGEDSLPKELLRLKKYGLEIEWCEDLKSYKKLIPALKKYPDSIIVTADDDLVYGCNWLLKLYHGYKKNPDVVWAHRVTKFEYENGRYITKAGGFNRWSNYSYLNKLTGGAGALYPPNIFDDEILKIEKFQKLCPTNDDIWFWLMAVKNGIKVGVPDNPDLRLVYVGNTQEGESLTKINDHGQHLFWKDFSAVLAAYPDVNNKLQREIQERQNDVMTAQGNAL